MRMTGEPAFSVSVWNQLSVGESVVSRLQLHAGCEQSGVLAWGWRARWALSLCLRFFRYPSLKALKA